MNISTFTLLDQYKYGYKQLLEQEIEKIRPICKYQVLIGFMKQYRNCFPLRVVQNNESNSTVPMFQIGYVRGEKNEVWECYLDVLNYSNHYLYYAELFIGEPDGIMIPTVQRAQDVNKSEDEIDQIVKIVYSHVEEELVNRCDDTPPDIPKEVITPEEHFVFYWEETDTENDKKEEFCRVICTTSISDAVEEFNKHIRHNWVISRCLENIMLWEECGWKKLAPKKIIVKEIYDNERRIFIPH